MSKTDYRRTQQTVVGSRNAKLVIPSPNLLLASLPPAQLKDLTAVSSFVYFRSGEIIYEGGSEIEHTHFPINCVVSSLALLEDGSTVEIAMTGREGLVGIPGLVGGGGALHWTRASVPGTALKVSREVLETLSNRHVALRLAILKSYRSLFRQICQRSVCNVRHTLVQRLCVWLLMMHDRVGRAELPLTQEEIARRISVRRAGVSVATTLLQSMQAITARRGKIVILDRARLERQACECYQVMKRDFATDPESEGLVS